MQNRKKQVIVCINRRCNGQLADIAPDTQMLTLLIGRCISEDHASYWLLVGDAEY